MERKFLLLIISILLGCDSKSDCNELETLNREQECIAIVTELPVYANIFLSNGIDPNTNKKCACIEADRWWRNYIDEIEIGDTIIKKKGELSFNIHKKGRVITHYWECKGKVYK